MNISFFLSHNYVNTFVHFCVCNCPFSCFLVRIYIDTGQKRRYAKKIHFTASFIQLKDTSKMDFFEIYFY